MEIATLHERKSCPYEEEEYKHGHVLCIDGVSMVCLNGRWEDNEKSNRIDLSE